MFAAGHNSPQKPWMDVSSVNKPFGNCKILLLFSRAAVMAPSYRRKPESREGLA